METNEIKNQQELKRLAQSHFVLLKPYDSAKDLYTVEFHTTGYLDLFITISSLINVSIMALDGMAGISNSVKSPEMHIKNVLEIATQLLPIEEADFLDKSRDLLLKRKEA